MEICTCVSTRIARQFYNYLWYINIELFSFNLKFRDININKKLPIFFLVIGRCISLRYINFEWITIAKKLAIKLKDSNDEDTIYAIAIFWISLSDFYFECNMVSLLFTNNEKHYNYFYYYTLFLV